MTVFASRIDICENIFHTNKIQESTIFFKSFSPISTTCLVSNIFSSLLCATLTNFYLKTYTLLP